MSPMANECSGSGYTPPSYLSLNGTSACTRYITASTANMSLAAFASQNNVALATLVGMNNIDTTYASNLTYCVPAACQMLVNSVLQGAVSFVAGQSSFVLPQFFVWNPYIDPHTISVGEPICVG